MSKATKRRKKRRLSLRKANAIMLRALKYACANLEDVDMHENDDGEPYSDYEMMRDAIDRVEGR